MKAALDKAWAERCRLYAEADLLWGNGIHAVGFKRLLEIDNLSTKGTDLWNSTIHRLCGDDALIEYDTPDKGDCTVQGVMVFYKN